MTHHVNPELLNHVLQLFTDHGHDGFAEGLRLLVNEAMRVERQYVLQAQPYERTEARKGYANGYKPKTLNSRLGPITFSIPQVRGQTPFYPSALDKGRGGSAALAFAPPHSRGVTQVGKRTTYQNGFSPTVAATCDQDFCYFARW